MVLVVSYAFYLTTQNSTDTSTSPPVADPLEPETPSVAALVSELAFGPIQPSGVFRSTRTSPCPKFCTRVCGLKCSFGFYNMVYPLYFLSPFD